MRQLKELLLINKFLSFLDISSTGLGNDGMDLICDILIDENLTTLHSLKCGMNDINNT